MVIFRTVLVSSSVIRCPGYRKFMVALDSATIGYSDDACVWK